MDEAVEFSSNGTAQVSEKVGEKIVEQVDAVENYETNTDNE